MRKVLLKYKKDVTPDINLNQNHNLSSQIVILELARCLAVTNSKWISSPFDTSNKS